MPEDNNGTTYSFDVCSQCKSICCQDAKPPLSEKRIKILQEYLIKQKISITEPFAKNDYSYPAVDEDIYCRLFSRQTGKCMVHPVKPETCVSGPITFDINFRTKKVEWFLKTSDTLRLRRCPLQKQSWLLKSILKWLKNKLPL